MESLNFLENLPLFACQHLPVDISHLGWSSGDESLVVSVKLVFYNNFCSVTEVLFVSLRVLLRIMNKSSLAR